MDFKISNWTKMTSIPGALTEILPIFVWTQKTMETKRKEDIASSMKPYMDEYATVSSNLIPRMNTLDKEFSSLIEGKICDEYLK